MRSSILLVTALLTLAIAAPAYADYGHGHDDGHRHDDHWHGDGHWYGDDHWHDRDIRYFHEHDFDYWRGGHWFHGFHDGRDGWWWMVGDGWYFYSAPIYPYPDPYLPPGVLAGPVPPSPIYTAAPEFVYYCNNPAGYYPYISRCYSSWVRVATSTAVQPAAPPPAPMPAPEPMHGATLSQRDQDDRQLNSLAVEFAQIDRHDRYARSKLKDLETRVESFHQSLFHREYNAMDILKDTEDLEHRIATQRAKIPSHPTATSKPAEAPEPQSVAPGPPIPPPAQ